MQSRTDVLPAPEWPKSTVKPERTSKAQSSWKDEEICSRISAVSTFKRCARSTTRVSFVDLERTRGRASRKRKSAAALTFARRLCSPEPALHRRSQSRSSVSHRECCPDHQHHPKFADGMREAQYCSCEYPGFCQRQRDCLEPAPPRC